MKDGLRHDSVPLDQHAGDAHSLGEMTSGGLPEITLQ